MGVCIVPPEQVLATTIPDMDALRIVLARVLSKRVQPDSIPGNPVLQLHHSFRSTTLTLRVYVVTGRNKLLTAVPGFITIIQFFFGCYVWVQVHGLGAVVWPAINYDAFRLCFFNQTEIQQVLLLSFSLIYDLLAFLIIAWVGRTSTGLRQSKVPSILDRIVKDATLYFVVIFTSHLLVECFVLFAPKTYHLLPANSNAIFIPIMATRLMLSLKKAADQSGSFTRTEDLDGVDDLVFAGGGGQHTTMEYAMEVGVAARRDRFRDQAMDLELQTRT